jgi:hypothetical protein
MRSETTKFAGPFGADGKDGYRDLLSTLVSGNEEIRRLRRVTIAVRLVEMVIIGMPNLTWILHPERVRAPLQARAR